MIKNKQKNKTERNLEDGRVKYKSHDEMVEATNKRRNEKYASDPEYREKIQKRYRDKYRKENGLIVGDNVMFDVHIGNIGTERIIVDTFNQSLIGSPQITYTSEVSGEILGVTDQTIMRWIKMEMIPPMTTIALFEQEITKRQGLVGETATEIRKYKSKVYLLSEIRAIARHLRTHNMLRFSKADTHIINNIKKDILNIRGDI